MEDEKIYGHAGGGSGYANQQTEVIGSKGAGLWSNTIFSVMPAVETKDEFEPAPMEYFHGKILEFFHELRKEKGGGFTVKIDGSDLNKLIARAKVETYGKYPKQVNNSYVLKSEM